jgi:hypothetical protein
VQRKEFAKQRIKGRGHGNFRAGEVIPACDCECGALSVRPCQHFVRIEQEVVDDHDRQAAGNINLANGGTWVKQGLAF